MARVNVSIKVLGNGGETFEQMNNIGGNRDVEGLKKLGPNAYNRQLMEMIDRTVHRKFGPNSAFFDLSIVPTGTTTSGQVAKKEHGMSRYYDLNKADKVNITITTEDGEKLEFRAE